MTLVLCIMWLSLHHICFKWFPYIIKVQNSFNNSGGLYFHTGVIIKELAAGAILRSTWKSANFHKYNQMRLLKKSFPLRQKVILMFTIPLNTGWFWTKCVPKSRFFGNFTLTSVMGHSDLPVTSSPSLHRDQNLSSKENYSNQADASPNMFY